MNISREKTGDLTATVRIEIVPADYTGAVEKQISDYRRKASIPGFRPGHVPAGLVRKMYGKAILAEEVNKLISENLIQYIKDENLDILGNPIPNTEKGPAIDFDHQDTFEFFFDLGFTPTFTIPLDQDLNIEHVTIAVSDDMIAGYIKDTRKRFGKPVISEDETPSENSETAEGETKAEPEVEPAEMTPDFFNMVYPGLNLQTEEEFVAQVKKDAAGSFAGETDKLLFNKITEALVRETKMELPDSFLKNWLIETNEEKYTPEDIERDYPHFVDSMKWQLIENKIIREHNIGVTDEDIRNYIRTYMFRQMNFGEMDPEMQKKYDSVIDTLMQNKEQVEKINDMLYNGKLMDFFKANVKVHEKEVSYEEYVKIASTMHHHGHHGHDHDHHHHHHNDDQSTEKV